MTERLPEPERRLTEAQVESLRDLCDRYGVEYSPDHYHVYPPDSVMMPGWAEGFIGGQTHAPKEYGGTDKATIYIGCDPDGRCHS